MLDLVFEVFYSLDKLKDHILQLGEELVLVNAPHLEEPELHFEEAGLEVEHFLEEGVG